MKLLIRDIIFILFSISVMLGAGFLLHREMTQPLSGAKTEEIGTITFRKEYAGRKYTGEVIWQELGQHSPVYNLDSIRTVNNSAASIHLKDGTIIDLEENTLILLSVDSEKVDLKLTDGSIFAKASTGKKGAGVNIMSDGTSVSVNDGAVNLEKKGESLKLNVSSGSVKLEGGGTAETISNGKHATVSEKGIDVKDVDVLAVEPLHNSYAVTTLNEKKIIFRWKKKKNTSILLEVSKKRDFSRKFFAVNTDKDFYSHSFLKGEYYWRISTPAPESYRSPVCRFIVISNAEPEIIKPVDREEFLYINTFPLLNFRWAGDPLVKNYRLQISNDKNFKNIIKEVRSNFSNCAMDSFGSGIYYCRIGAIYPGSGEIFFSKSKSFKIDKTSVPPVPALNLPEKNQRCSLLMAETEGIIFNCSHVKVASFYEFEVATDSDFKNIVVKKKTDRNFYKVKEKIKAGSYFWRVRSIASDGSKSPYSEKRPVQFVEYTKIVQYLPKNKSKLSLLESEDKIKFKWNDPNHGDSYRFKLSEDRNMKKVIIHESVSGNSVLIDKLPPGRYFWCIDINRSGKVIATSGVSSFILMGKLDRPDGCYPSGGKSVNLQKKNSLKFKWGRVKGATHYSFEIFYYKGRYKKRIFSRIQKETKFLLKNFSILDTDTYFWQVKAFKKGSNGKKMESSFSKNYFRITLGESGKSGKINITSPKVVYVE